MIIGAIGLVWQVLWWIAIGAFLLVVVPVVVFIANRIVWAGREIRAYATDVLEHGVGVAGNLDSVPELERTTKLVKEVHGGLQRYTKLVRRLVQEGT